MRKVPFIDSTGIHNLESLCHQSKREGIQLVLSGVKDNVKKTLNKAGFSKFLSDEFIYSNINDALKKAEELCK
jgi:SulP family sulfate permease